MPFPVWLTLVNIDDAGPSSFISGVQLDLQIVRAFQSQDLIRAGILGSQLGVLSNRRRVVTQ